MPQSSGGCSAAAGFALCYRAVSPPQSGATEVLDRHVNQQCVYQCDDRANDGIERFHGSIPAHPEVEQVMVPMSRRARLLTRHWARIPAFRSLAPTAQGDDPIALLVSFVPIATNITCVSSNRSPRSE